MDTRVVVILSVGIPLWCILRYLYHKQSAKLMQKATDLSFPGFKVCSDLRATIPLQILNCIANLLFRIYGHDRVSFDPELRWFKSLGATHISESSQIGDMCTWTLGGRTHSKGGTIVEFGYVWYRMVSAAFDKSAGYGPEPYVLILIPKMYPSKSRTPLFLYTPGVPILQVVRCFIYRAIKNRA